MNIPVVVATGMLRRQPGRRVRRSWAEHRSPGSDLPTPCSPTPSGGIRPSAAPSATDLAAPGKNLIAPTLGKDFSPVTGTSFAAAEVSGSIVLLQQIYKSRFGTLPAYDDLMGWLQQGATQIKDSVTGITIGRIDIRQIGLADPRRTRQPAERRYPVERQHAPNPAAAGCRPVHARDAIERRHHHHSDDPYADAEPGALDARPRTDSYPRTRARTDADRPLEPLLQRPGARPSRAGPRPRSSAA
ncbi:MAG: hypothetical protein U0800_07080 [Isosphaeraceae bacterium]